ncbi:MAG: putative toxin-antitoxin system toxin component, PIN family [Bdellovibrio sp.]|nr:putative toxin-antitoxin system toxin component, PIN family [Bdellovibrio sp.]
MNVVLDTNILASGIFWNSGPPAFILKAWQQEQYCLVVTSEIFDEYRQTLAELDKKYPGFDIERMLNYIQIHAHFVTPVHLMRQLCSDPDDDQFIAAALAGQAEYLVTGDKALLKVKKLPNLSVVTARQFITKIICKV